jgi:predicted component of type VI protein secretion system
VFDETTGENERQLAFARGNVRLLFADELREGYSAIKIASASTHRDGAARLSEEWIPPALDVSASLWLVKMLRQLVEILITKSSTLSEQRANGQPDSPTLQPQSRDLLAAAHRQCGDTGARAFLSHAPGASGEAVSGDSGTCRRVDDLCYRPSS